MKKFVQPKTDQELIKQYPLTNIVEGWFFQVTETSQGVYSVEGVDRWGRSVSRQGIDPEILLGELKKDIDELFKDTKIPSNRTDESR
jgi:hypothetical protein